MNLSKLAITLAVGLAALGTANTASAEESSIKVSADLGVVIPLGDWADFSGPGFGPIVRGAMVINDKMDVVGRLGYIYHLPKDVAGVDLSTAELLVLGGIRYDLGPVGVDVATGINNWSISVGDASESETRIPLMIGASAPIGKIEVGGNLLIPNLLLTEDGEDTQMGLLFNVGYRFL